MLHPSIESLSLPDDLKSIIQKNVYLGYKEELEKKWKPFDDQSCKMKRIFSKSHEIAYIDFATNEIKEKLIAEGIYCKKGFFRFTYNIDDGWYYFSEDLKKKEDAKLYLHRYCPLKFRIDRRFFIGYFKE